MLKVIIADDEARVCRLVQMLVDWEAMGMSIAATASNGLEALDLVETLKPDILITDIRMPGCDGLELIDRAKKILPELEIILISGYAQFEYAQTAMRYGVSGYLLKPIKKGELTETLEKLVKRRRDRADSAAAVETLLQDSNRSHDLLRNRLTQDLLNGRLTLPSARQLHSEYGFCVQGGMLQVFILKMDYDPENIHETPLPVLKNKAEEILKSAVFPLCLNSVFQFFAQTGYGILNYDIRKNDQIRRELRVCLNQLETQKPLFGSMAFSLAVGPAADTPEKLPLSMRGARNAIADRLVEGTGRLLEAAPEIPRLGAQKLLDKYNRAMDHIVDALSTQAAENIAEELYNEIRGTAGVRGYEILDLVLSAGRVFLMRLYMREETDLIRAFEERCDLCGSTEALFACLRGFQRQQIQAVLERRENEAIRPIRIAKQFISQHFSEAITLEDVCAATGFSTSYFSAMFKKETGEGFSKYLTRVRIEKAKDLLQDTNLPVSGICTQVGYSDIKHFTNTFKKMTSLSPGQYRKLYG